MSFIIILAFGFATVSLGRRLFRRWFNHVSLYGIIWSVSLLLFEMRLVQYYQLQIETWLIIFAGWIAFVAGSIIVALQAGTSKDQLSTDQPPSNPDSLEKETHYLRVILWILIVLSFAAAVQHWFVVVGRFGSIANVLILGNYLYSLRVSEGLPGAIPYLGSLALTGALLGGVYTGLQGKLRLVAILPLIIIILIEIASMGRAKMIMAAILFATGYFLTRSHSASGGQMQQKYKRALTLAAAVVILAMGSEFVRSVRGSAESFSGSTQTLRTLRGSAFITPSIYLYLTVNYGVLDQFLKKDEEKSSWGANTFAPVYRALAKIGFDTYFPHYQRFYRTPANANTGTYLREFLADFGILGILIVPFFLGLAISHFWFSYQRKMTYTSLAVLSYLFVWVGMSIFYGVTRSGDLLVCLLASLTCGLILDRKLKGPRTQESSVHD